MIHLFIYAFAAALTGISIYYLLTRYFLYLAGPSKVTMKVFDELPQPVFFFDEKGLIRYCNTYSQKVLGFKQEDILDLPMETLFRKEDALKALTKQTSLAGAAGPEKLYLRSVDGSGICFNLSFAELKGALGDYYGMLVYGEDVQEAEKLKAELERREINERNLKAMSNSLEEVVANRTEELTRSIGEARREMNYRLIKEKELRATIEDMEIMLGEIHSRQKKNMKLILNMLNAKKWRRTSKAQQHKTGILYHRLKAIHMVYEHVFFQDHREYVDFQAFIFDLTDKFHAMYCDDKSIEISLSAEEHSLQVDQAFPLGLSLSEIMHVAFKAAMFGRKSNNNTPKISVKYAFSQLHNRYNLEINVSGDTKYLPEQILADNHSGLQLAKMLIGDQLNGKISIFTQHAFSIQISFAKLKESLAWQLN